MNRFIRLKITCATLIGLAFPPVTANAEIIAAFDLGSTTTAVVQTGFTGVGVAGAGNSGGAIAGSVSASMGGITMRLSGNTTMASATTKDAAGNFNSEGSLTARDRGTPSADTGSFTFSDVYRDFLTANFLGIQFSGLTPNTSYAVRFYAYDNSGSRTQTFADVTPGSTGSSGTVTYTSAFAFSGGTPNDAFSTTINATSDAQGRLFFTESGAGSTNVALFNAVVIDGVLAPVVYDNFHHGFNGNLNDSNPTSNHGTPSGSASITTVPAAIASGSGALSLDGTDASFVTLAHPVTLTAANAWTATWWARRTALGSDKGMVMGSSASTRDFICLNDSSSGLRFRSSSDESFDFATPKDGELRHYALVANGAGNLSLYLDGAPAQSLTGDTSFVIDSIGKAFPTETSHLNFQGSLDEIHLYNSALGAQQVAALYEAEKPAPEIIRIRIVLLGGQSNADGRAAVSGLPTAPTNLQNPQSDVSFFHKVQGGTATLTTLRPGLSETAQFGPEITLGRVLADLWAGEPGTRVAIIKYANGGTNLHTQWKGGGDANTSNDGSEYTVFQQTVSSGLAALAAAYPQATLDLQGMAWLQGESDATSTAAPAYQANLTAFISDLRATYGSDLPFIIARLSSGQTNLNSTYLNQVRAAQDAVAAANPRTGILFTDSFGLNGDNLHFSAGGQQSIGRGFAERIAYYGWMADTFTAADISAGFAAATADRDGDGLTNLQEYASGTDPTSQTGGPIAFTAGGSVTAPGLPFAANFAEGAGEDYRAVFGRRKNRLAAGLNYTVQFSANLSDWMDSGAIPTVLTAGSSTGNIEAVSVPFPLSVPAAGGSAKPTFFRVGIAGN